MVPGLPWKPRRLVGRVQKSNVRPKRKINKKEEAKNVVQTGKKLGLSLKTTEEQAIKKIAKLL